MSLKRITHVTKIYATFINVEPFRVCIFTVINWLRISCLFSKIPEGGLGSIQRECFIAFQNEFSDWH